MTTIYARVTQNQRSTYKDITIDQGSTYSDTIVLKNVDDTAFNLTGWNVRGQLRRSVSNSTNQAFTMTVTDAVNGTFTINLTSVETAALTVQNYMSTTYVYDVEIYDTSNPPVVHRVLRGRAKIEPEVTR